MYIRVLGPQISNLIGKRDSPLGVFEIPSYSTPSYIFPGGGIGYGDYLNPLGFYEMPSEPICLRGGGFVYDGDILPGGGVGYNGDIISLGWLKRQSQTKRIPLGIFITPAYEGVTTYHTGGRGKNRIYNVFSVLEGRGSHVYSVGNYPSIGRGKYDLVYHRYFLGMRGKGAIFKIFTGHVGRGTHSVTILIHCALGRGKHKQFYQYTLHGSGARVTLNLFNLKGRGRHTILIPITAKGCGRYVIPFPHFDMQSCGRFAFLISLAEELQGRNRIANDALAGYELYRGVDSLPDLDEAPWETFSTFPYESIALEYGHTYYFVLRKRNAWDLVSQNIEEWSMTIDASGNQEVTHPSAPEEITAEASAGGRIKVKANYFYSKDGDNQASRYLVYLTGDGSDPDPGTDEPTEVTMSKVDGVARLNWLSSVYADGTTIKVLVRTRRIDDGPANVDSNNTDIYSAEADIDGPAKPEPAGIFFGKIVEQRQVN